MAHRLPTNSYSRAGAETIQRAQIGISSSEKHIVVFGFGSAEEIKFVELVISPGFIEGCCPDEAARWKPDRQAVGAGGSIDIVRGLSAAAAGHIFRQNIGLSRNMLF